MTIRRSRPAAPNANRGAIAVQFAILLVAIIGFAALGTEIVMLLYISRQMQSAADAAALAGSTAKIKGYPADYTQEAFAVAAASGFVVGQNGTTVTVNSPPANGNYIGATNAVEVAIAQPQNLALAGLLHAGPFTVHGYAVAQITGYGSCVLALDPSGSGAFSMTGASTSTFTGCNLSVNSSSATAVSGVGGASLTVNQVQIAGSYSLTGGATITASAGILTNAAVTSDPYANYNPPAMPAGCLQNNFTGTPSPASPGVYCNGISLTGHTALTLNPGIYYIDRGSLSLKGGSSISGTGVTFVLTSSTGANYATVTIAGGSTLNLSAPTTGATAGVLFFQDRRAPTGVTDNFSGGIIQKLVGALYFPEQTLKYAGGTATTITCTELIARDVKMVGNSTLKVDCAGTGVLAIGVQPSLAE